MKKIILSLNLLTAIAPIAEGATINWASGGGRGHMFVTGDGARVPTGSLVRVGFFQEPGNINSSFIEFGTTTVGDPGTSGALVGLGGHIPASGRSIANNSVEGNSNFDDVQLYIWVYNAPTAAAATQNEVFTATGTLWRTPTTFVDNLASFAITLGAASGAPPAGITALGDGSVTNAPFILSGASSTGALVYNLGVPEPTSIGLMSLAGLVLMRRKRS